MSQLIKHYWINRDTGEWATDTYFGLMMPIIKGLKIEHELFTENNIPFFLSTIPEYHEYEVTILPEELLEYQNNSDITIISYNERQIEVPVDNFGGGDVRNQTVYDVVYREPYIINETTGEGLRVITQQQWDFEISNFDSIQQEKRYNILREIRDELLKITDWISIKSNELGSSLPLDFKIWRQSLRDLPNSVQFPSSFPDIPTILDGNKEIENLYNKFDNVRTIVMINDPLSSQSTTSLP